MNQPTPQHIAIIMDGNGRWAQKRLLPRTMGHVKGAAMVKRIVRACLNHGIGHLTIFAFSTENWRRPPQEVSILMDLFSQYLRKEIAEMSQGGIRLRVIGDRTAFSSELVTHIEQAEASTAHNSRLNLTVAANYGGHWDIVQAAQAWQKNHPDCSLEQMTENDLSGYLSTNGMPCPDLLIRTGGESRISNFMLWQLAYTELYFTDIFWPDFNEAALENALHWYRQRIRRFGRTDEQVLEGQLASQPKLAGF